MASQAKKIEILSNARKGLFLLRNPNPLGIKLTKCMTMHLVNLAKSSKSIFEFRFSPVITRFFFLKTQGSAKVKGGGGKNF